VSTTSTSSLNSKFATQIEQLIQLESGPLNAVLMKKSTLSVTQGILSDLGTMLSDLRSTLDSLRGSGSLSSLMAFTVTSGNSSVVTASANSGASRGTHQVTVQDLARGHMVGSSGMQQDGTAFSAGTYGFDVVVAGKTTHISVVVGAGDTNSTVLSNVATALNASGAAVSASVVTTDAGAGTKKLIVQSTTGGVANILSSIQDTAGGLASQLGIAGASTKDAYSANTLQQAKDAAFTLDGITMSSSTNEVSNVLSGVTINLFSKSDTPVSFTISADTAAVRKVLDNFMAKFNTLVSALRAKSAVSADGKTRGPLSGNSTFSGLKSSLFDLAAAPVGGMPTGAPTMLADLGIDIAQDGTLSMTDESKLTAAINANATQVVNLFSGDNGISGRLFTLVNEFTGSSGGMTYETKALSELSGALASKQTQLQARLDRRRTQLVAQFAKLQNLASMLSQQQAELASITG
jgi:flagellar hook-associated protein 2